MSLNPAVARAQGVVVWEPVDRQIDWGTWLFENIIDGYGNAVDGLSIGWHALIGPLAPINPFAAEAYDETGRRLTPAEVTVRDAARRQEYRQIIKDAGFDLVCTVSTVGFSPQLSYTFRNVRELTEADDQAVHRRLERFRRIYSGFYARIDGMVLDAILKTSDYADRIAATSVVVALLPLPNVTVTSMDPARAAQADASCGSAL